MSGDTFPSDSGKIFGCGSCKVERSKKGLQTSDVLVSNNLTKQPYALELSDAKAHVAVGEKEIT